MDPQSLGLSVSFAAAKVAVALWIGQLALPLLDRRRVTLAWQIVLSAATIVTSWWAVRSGGLLEWWTPAWVTSSVLAATALLDCVRRWISAPLAGEPVSSASISSRARRGSHRIYDLICLIGWAIAHTACAMAILAQLPPETLTRASAVVQMSVSAGLLGVALVASIELTVGATGATLLALNWRRLATVAAGCLLVQLVLSAVLIVFRRNAATLSESLAPIFFAVGMAMVAYIVWAIPRQMVSLTAKGRMEGHVSLALAGWLATICLAVACGLPPAWPWKQVGTESSTQSR